MYSMLAVIGIVFSLGHDAVDDQAEARAVLDRAVRAFGGEEKLRKLQHLSIQGTIKFEGGGQMITATIDGKSSGPDLYRMEVEIDANGMKNKVCFGIRGDAGWTQSNNQSMDMPKPVALLVRDVLYGVRILTLLASVKDKDFTISHLGELKLGDQAAIGLRISRKDWRDVSVYFDKESGLPVQSEITVTDPNGQDAAFVFRFSDYKDVDGIKWFSRIAIKVNETEATADMGTIQAVEAIEASFFEKP
jgi:hypothetical protein